jgi:hypothetical protein
LDSGAGGSTGGREEAEGAGHSHEGPRRIPTRGGGSRTARLPPPLPSPASRASPEISEFELELSTRGVRFNFYFSRGLFFVFPLHCQPFVFVLALTSGPRDRARAGPARYLISYGPFLYCTIAFRPFCDMFLEFFYIFFNHFAKLYDPVKF